MDKTLTVGFAFTGSYCTFSKIFPVLEEIAESAKTWSQAYVGLDSLSIEQHKKVQDDVYLTVYENGVGFYVNYGDNDVNINGLSVKANDYLRIEGQK